MPNRLLAGDACACGGLYVYKGIHFQSGCLYIVDVFDCDRCGTTCYLIREGDREITKLYRRRCPECGGHYDPDGDCWLCKLLEKGPRASNENISPDSF
jgi:DNA-directed RNA polymerase subunit RPC12/RpoP